MGHPRAPIVVILAATLAGCGGGDTTGPPGGTATVEITPSVADTFFSIGDSLRLEVVVRDAEEVVIPAASIEFTSSDRDIATVSAGGIVVSTGNGSASITARSGPATASVPVRVRQKLATVALAPSSARIAVNGTRTLSAAPADARGAAISGLPSANYSSSATEVATVNAAGVVTGMNPGGATITATVTSAADGSRSGTAAVTIVVTRDNPTVTLGATNFSPAAVDIPGGGSVTFANTSGIAHDVDFGRADLNVGVHNAGVNTRTFPKAAGSFPYHCNLHAGMVGTVFVH